MIKSFPPISIKYYQDISDQQVEFFRLLDLLKGYTDYEENSGRFIAICERLSAITDSTPIISRLDNTTFQCSWGQYNTPDSHWVISFYMDFAKVDSYSVYFCRNNSCFTTEFNDKESAVKLVKYLFDRVRENTELWV